MAGLAVKMNMVAALRETRKSAFPDPVAAAVMAELAGADGIAVHLREDRQDIQDRDVRILRQTIQSKLILEMASTTEMVGMALDIKPDHVTLVPEKRVEFSAGGGLDLVVYKEEIREIVDTLQNSGIPVGILIDPAAEQLKQAHRTNAKIVELHTGAYAEATGSRRAAELHRLARAAGHAAACGLIVNAGHGLDYHNVQPVAALPEVAELNIGHAIVSRALFSGLASAVSDMKRLMREARAR